MDLTVLYQISYGMYIIGVCESDRPTGCVINTFTQITSENPMVAVCLNKNSYTYAVLERTRRFSLSVLSEETGRNAISVFGFADGRKMDKFAHVRHKMREASPMCRRTAAAG